MGRRLLLRKVIIGVGAFLALHICTFPITVSAMPISPYYRHFMPEHKSQILQDRVVTTISEGKTHVTLYTNITAHELGIRVSSFEDGEVTHTGRMIVRTIKKRPITARRSIWDDGSIFQFWEYHTGTRSNPVTVLFGYTTDPEFERVS